MRLTILLRFDRIGMYLAVRFIFRKPFRGGDNKQATFFLEWDAFRTARELEITIVSLKMNSTTCFLQPIHGQ